MAFYRADTGMLRTLMRCKAMAAVFLLISGISAMHLMTSCTGEHADDCFTNSGPQIKETRPAGIIERIELCDNVNLVLIP